MLEFNPMLTPREMIERGIFGGAYFSKDLLNEGDGYKFYDKLFSGLDSNYLINEKYKASINQFKIRSGMDYNYWCEQQWIHKDDPHGWFEWYCKYFLGRRHSDDDRQIRRWQDFCGPRGRWRLRIYKNIYNSKGDWKVSPRIQQSLLHWSYLVNEEDYQLWQNMYR